MIIIGGKLLLDGKEYDILRFGYHFQRDVDAKNRPCSVYYGGEITVQMESTDDVAIFRKMTQKGTPSSSGSIEIYGSDDICIRQIVFEKAYIYAYGEEMHQGSFPIVTTIGISPMRLDFNNNTLRLDRRWPEAPHGWAKYEAPESKYASAAAAEEELTPECTVSFRRRKDYDSSFGFDWLRVGDTGESGDDWYRNTLQDRSHYDRLVTEYRSFTQSWKQQSEAHKSTACYVIPWVTLMKGGKARFRMKLEVNRPSGTLTVKVVGGEASALSVNLTTIDAQQTGDYYHSTDLEVSCNAVFSSELALEVRADGELVGKMLFVPNNRVRTLDVAIVTVTTKSSDGKRTFVRKPDPALLDEVSRLLGQAYIVPNFKHYNLNLSLPAECNGESRNDKGERRKAVEVVKYGGTNPKNIQIGVELHSTNSLFNILWKDERDIFVTNSQVGKKRFESVHNFLNKMLNYYHKTESQSLNGVIRLYFINEDIKVNNYVAGTALEKANAACISSKGYNRETITHELLHCLSLDHTFEQGAYLFKKFTTDNLMDYDEDEAHSVPRRSLWYWQMKQLWRKLK